MTNIKIIKTEKKVYANPDWDQDYSFQKNQGVCAEKVGVNKYDWVKGQGCNLPNNDT